MTPTVDTDVTVAPANPAAAPPGLRNASRVLLEHLGDHLDLLRLEAAQELSRLGGVVGLWFVLALVVQLGMIFGVTLLIATLWNTEYRTHAMFGSGIVMLVSAAYCYWQIQRLGSRATQRFAGTSQQWKRDLDLIRELI
ncbi:MAG: phage holin family protein [Stagnimonas sp.]|nr:phage holin family protein [Stagnimonas sp.]